MESVVANIYAACLSAEAEPNAELVDLTIAAIQDGVAGSNKDEALGAVFTAVEELAAERRQKGALFRIKLAAIASAAKSLPQSTRDVLLKSLRAMGEAARQHALVATTDTIHLIVDAIAKAGTTAVGQPASPPVAPVVQPSPVSTLKSQSAANITLQEYLKQKGRYVAGDKIHFAPDIPLKKISGAMHSTDGQVRAEDVVILIDDTAFGGAKEGVYFTNDCIYVKEVMTRLAVYRLDAINHIGVDGNTIFINQRKVVGLTMPNKRDMALLFSAINDYLAGTRTKSDETLTHPAASQAAPPHPEAEEDDEADESAEHHGFFYTTAAQVAFDNDVPKIVRAFLVDFINASMGLFQFLKSQEKSMSSRAQWVATSDFVHFESVIYAVALTIYLMDKKIVMSQPLKDGLYNFVFALVVVTYIDEFIDEEAITQHVKKRLSAYGTLMRGSPGELPNAMRAYLAEPCVLEVFDEDSQEEAISAISELRDGALSREMVSAYLRNLSEKVESALIRYVEQLDT